MPRHPLPLPVYPFPPPTPKPAPPVDDTPPSEAVVNAARAILRRMLREHRWDNSGGYVGRWDGRWHNGQSIGIAEPDELDTLFAFAGLTADEIEPCGDCADCANAINGRERGYAEPCVSCLRPFHNHFVPKPGGGRP